MENPIPPSGAAPSPALGAPRAEQFWRRRAPRTPHELLDPGCNSRTSGAFPSPFPSLCRNRELPEAAAGVTGAGAPGASSASPGRFKAGSVPVVRVGFGEGETLPVTPTVSPAPKLPGGASLPGATGRTAPPNRAARTEPRDYTENREIRARDNGGCQAGHRGMPGGTSTGMPG